MNRIATRPRTTPATLTDVEREEGIQALSNAHYKPPGAWHDPSPAPRQKTNSSDYLSMWIGSSVYNYRALIAGLLVQYPSDSALLWLKDNEPNEALALRFDDVAQYYSVGRYHGAIDQAHRYALENAASIRLWCKRSATPYTPPTPLPVCAKCGRDKRQLNGQYGLFWGCLPCYHTEKQRKAKSIEL